MCLRLTRRWGLKQFAGKCDELARNFRSIPAAGLEVLNASARTK
jgi:hypothetical protein